MFGNKGYGAKLLAALALIAGLGVYAGKRGDELNPALWRCVVEPRRWDGTTIWIPSARIRSVSKQSYTIRVGGLDADVLGYAPGPAGARMTLIAVFHADGPVLQAKQERLIPESAWRRLLMEIVSVVVVLAVLVNLLRHFAFRPAVLQAQEGGAP